MPNHCSQFKFDHPDAIAQGFTDWIEANPVLDKIIEVVQITTMEPVTGLQVSASQPSAKYVFNFFIWWTSKQINQHEDEDNAENKG